MPIMAYLATPYTFQSKSKEIGMSKPDNSEQAREVEQQRYETVTEVAAKLYQIGITPISPITQAHPIRKDHGLEKSFDFWAEHDFNMILRCDMVLVLMQNGWQDSPGVQQEVQFAKQNNIPVIYISYNGQQIILGE